jgi:hypothetical protein
MSPTVRWICGSATFAAMVAAAILMPTPPPPEPFDEGRWTVDSVMLLDEPIVATYAMTPPFRVVRGGRVTLSRDAGAPALPAMRVDLTIDGEHITLFSRVQNH